jgi:predicted transcriptional regulator
MPKRNITKSEIVKKTMDKYSNFEKRHCSKCAKQFGNMVIKKGKIKICDTHNTEQCNRNEIENKTNFQYSAPVLLDTCASTHFTNQVPKILNTTIQGIVRGSVKDAKSTKIIGTGNFKINDLKFKSSVAPGLDANLISAGKLINEGYSAILKKGLKPNVDVIVKKNNNEVAEGYIDSKNMIKLHGHLEEENNEDEVTRKSIGHVKCSCEICMEAKARKKNTSKGKGRTYEPLEKVSVDTQGPIQIRGIDGSKYNLKMVDSNSKYITAVPMMDKSAASTTEVISHFIKNNERKVEKKVKYIATDGGTEFYGDFLKLLSDMGITKIRGTDYNRSFPPDAENANGILNRITRSCLLESKLPPTYWPYALQYACYIYNREGNPSPFEKLYNRKPRKNHIKAFGEVCYSYKPIEKRNFKFEPVRIPCRFLGFADDDAPEIMNAYVLLSEETREIIYNDDVKFHAKPIFRKLPDDDEKEENMSLSNRFEVLSEDITDEYILEDVIISDDSTQANTEESDQIDIIGNQTQNNLRRSTRRDTMTHDEIRNVIDQSSDSEYESAEANDDSSESEMNMYSNHDEQEWSETEINEMWETLYFRYDVVHEIYRTNKQDKSIPKNYREFLKLKEDNYSEWENYNEAMKIEEANMIAQKVYTEIVDETPKDEEGNSLRYIDSTWTFAKMFDENGNLLKYKARLCGRGFREIQGIDYDEVYSPTVKQKMVRALVAIAANNDWEIYQDDCKAAYLNAVLKKGKWLKLPNGKYVFIKKCLYGLKESAREWFKMLKNYIKSEGFKQNAADPCVFFKVNKESKLDIVLSIFVDDILTTGISISIQEFRENFKRKFKVSEKGGICKHYLSIKFSRDTEYIYLDQTAYVNQKLEVKTYLLNPKESCASPLLPNFQELLIEANESKEIDTTFPYREMVGSLVYLANGTRFDITAALSVVSRFANNPKKIHCDMVRRIYRYLRGNNRKLRYKIKGEIKLVGYCDASLGNLENYASLAGFCFIMGESIISWKSFKEPVIALSTAEAEYIALTPAVQECIFLQNFLQSMGYQTTKTEIREDNNACIALAKNPQDKKRTRHIQIRFHWIREQLENGIFTLIPTKTLNQLADIFTKGMHGPQLKTISAKLGLVQDSVKQGESEIVNR